MTNKNYKIGQAGSLMIEALAMLGLISMVTPIIYKKAAERNSEIQDVNSAAQIRNIIRASDDYTRENHTKITAGNIIPANVDCPGSEEIDFSTIADAGEQHQEIPIANLCEYLPYGFLDNSGSITQDRIFGQNYKLIIKKAEGGVDGQKVLTNFLIASPKQGKDFAKIRTSRISSMIGSNGGFIKEEDDGSFVASGVQGMWAIEDPATSLGITIGDNAGDVSVGSIISSSIQPISTGGGADHLLHRNVVTGKPELNRMDTAINMNSNDINNINKAVITGAQLADADKNQALLLSDKAGAYITGVLGAAEMADGNLGFLVDENANLSTKGTLTANNGQFVVDSDKIAYKNSTNVDVFNVTKDGDMLLAKDAKIGGNTEINGTLKVDKSAIIGDGSNNKDDVQLTVDGSAYVKGNLIVDKKFKAKEIDTGILRAGTTDHTSNADKDYTLKVDSTALMVKDNTGSDRFSVDRATGDTVVNDGNLSVKKAGNKIFDVDQDSAYTTVNGLIAGTNSNAPALQVVNSGAGANNVFMNLVDSTNQITAYDNNNHASLSITSAKSILQKVDAVNTGIYSSLEAGAGFTQIVSQNGGSSNSIYLQPTSTTLNVNNATPAVNVGLYKEGIKGTKAEMWLADDTELKVISGASDPVFHVDTAINSANYVKNNTGKGSVYVRRGAIEVASGQSGRNNSVNPYVSGTDNEMGHIKADTLISNQALDNSKMVPSISNFSQGSTKYDTYMVNPAYTSVMHDIKLTTRGGARLSDVLPDFINKGIYVVDNTYAENKGLDVTSETNSTTAANGNPTSPWVGTVPAPQCPPGYQKVITAMPSTIAMAQAGYPITKGRGDRYGSADFEIPTDAFVQIVPALNDNQNFAPEPLYFQKSTWLKTKIYPVGGEDASTFKGWNILLGFIYPKSIYSASGYVGAHSGSVYEGNDLGVYWNLYPVFEKELEAFVYTYCYFARARWANDYVDSGYNQLDNPRGVHVKGDAGYNARLNDPNLKYDDVW